MTTQTPITLKITRTGWTVELSNEVLAQRRAIEEKLEAMRKGRILPR